MSVVFNYDEWRYEIRLGDDPRVLSKIGNALEIAFGRIGDERLRDIANEIEKCLSKDEVN